MTKYQLPVLTSFEREEYISGRRWSHIPPRFMKEFNELVAEEVAKAVADLPEGTTIDNDLIADLFNEACDEISWDYLDDYETDIDESYNVETTMQTDDGEVVFSDHQFVVEEEKE